jgi:hypothetical protein
MAEREGFEPPVRLPGQLISSQPHSTTLPPLLNCRAPSRPAPLRDAGQLIGFARALRACSPLRGALRASPFAFAKGSSQPHSTTLPPLLNCRAPSRPAPLRDAGQLIGFARALRACSPLRGALRASPFAFAKGSSQPHSTTLPPLLNCRAPSRPAPLRDAGQLIGFARALRESRAFYPKRTFSRIFCSGLAAVGALSDVGASLPRPPAGAGRERGLRRLRGPVRRDRVRGARVRRRRLCRGAWFEV